MAGSSNSIDTGALYFGSVNPTVTGQEVDNDSFIVTSDGLSTGTPISFWKFDEETLTWVQVPSGSTCPAPMTRAALVALRSANGLSKDCDYVITDHVQGRLVAGTTIHLQAVSANELSENVQVNTTYDNEAWRGVYDIDRGLVLELQDNRNNIARGINGTQVTNFDWGNTSYTNVVVDNATLTANIGNTASKNNVTIDKEANVNITGFTGSLQNITFSTAVTANFTNANGTWRLSTIQGGGTFNLSGYTGGGDNYYNQIDGACTINFSNSSSQVILRQSEITASSITHTGVSTGILSISTAKIYSSAISHSAGALALTISGNTEIVSGSNINHQTGTMAITNGQMRASTIQQDTNAGATMSLNQPYVLHGATIRNSGAGALNVTQSTFEQLSSAIRDAGATGTMTISYSTIGQATTIRNFATNIGSTAISYSEILGNSVLYNYAATTISATRLYLNGNSAVIANNGSAGAMNFTSVYVTGQSSVTKLAASTAGTMTLNTGTYIGGNSFIQTNGTGNLTASACEIAGASGINITAGNRSYSFTRLIQTGVSRANLSGTGAAITDTHNEFEMHYRGTYTNSCTGAANTINYCEVSGLSGALSLTGTTGGSNMNRIKLKDGTFSKANNPNAGTYQLWNISDSGVVTLTNHAANETINYLDVSNQGNITINRTGLGAISVVQVRNGGTLNITGTSTTISRLDVEQGSLNFSAGSISNVSKKMSSVFTINGGIQSNVYHWNAVNKTTTVNNTSRVDYLGVVSTVPIL